ncbi:triphosphate tunnel metalloenzyme 3-like [Euphorbia lathyris]|uniref:triphosphate tunnel metalloenzyme 3-like n=1 Tax=Euphorbia lathyris TaxID=212925 RepID=UPI003313DED1
MEVEVKLRLPDSTAHQNLSSLLSPFHTKTLAQQNFFFDTINSQLTSNLAVLRIRFYNQDAHCVLSLKAKPVLSNGISRVEEQEEPLDPLIGRLIVAEPSRLGSLESSNIMRRVREEFGVKEKELGFVGLGGFRNVRQVFDWKGLKLEVDETIYEFGTSYEIECESKEPERDKRLIEDLLNDNGIQFSYSKKNKFAVFRSGKLPSD